LKGRTGFQRQYCPITAHSSRKTGKGGADNGIEPHFAHPSYPQGKVKQYIQNLREFVNHLRKFGSKANFKRMVQPLHRGINTFPAQLHPV